jgi:hypothetical protein
VGRRAARVSDAARPPMVRNRRSAGLPAGSLLLVVVCLRRLRPRDFRRGRVHIGSGGIAAVIVAIAMSVWRADCGRQTSVTAGTIVHHSKLPLTAWFWGAYLMATHSNGHLPLQSQRQDGVAVLRQTAPQHARPGAQPACRPLSKYMKPKSCAAAKRSGHRSRRTQRLGESRTAAVVPAACASVECRLLGRQPPCLSRRQSRAFPHRGQRPRSPAIWSPRRVSSFSCVSSFLRSRQPTRPVIRRDGLGVHLGNGAVPVMCVFIALAPSCSYPFASRPDRSVTRIT